MTSELRDFLLMTLKKEEQLLHSKWLRSVTSEEYREGICAVKELILHQGVALWLTDSRLLGHILFSDQQWIRREIAPLIKASNLQRIARVLTEDVFSYISFENIIQQMKEEHDLSFDLAQFTSMEAAVDWLRME